MPRRRQHRARSSADGEILTFVGEAQDKLRQAAGVCRRVQRESRGVRSRRAYDALRQIQRALGLLQGLRGTEPRYDMDDPDLMPEDQRPSPPPKAPEGS